MALLLAHAYWEGAVASVQEAISYGFVRRLHLQLAGAASVPTHEYPSLSPHLNLQQIPIKMSFPLATEIPMSDTRVRHVEYLYEAQYDAAIAANGIPIRFFVKNDTRRATQ